MNARCQLCLECGESIIGGRAGQEFCCTGCRQSFNNRRLARGAELYDLLRALRRERGLAKNLNIWTHICRLEQKWQAEDDRQRPGRKSYMPPQKALAILRDKGSLPRGEVLCHSYLSGAK